MERLGRKTRVKIAETSTFDITLLRTKISRLLLKYVPVRPIKLVSICKQI